MLFYFLLFVYVVFLIVFWEGFLGGVVYVNCFVDIMEKVLVEDCEFSFGVMSVSDSVGICLVGIVGIVLELRLCVY